MISILINPFSPDFSAETQYMRLSADEDANLIPMVGQWALIESRDGFSCGCDAVRYITDPLTGPAFGNAPRLGGRPDAWEHQGGLVGKVRAAGKHLVDQAKNPAVPVDGFAARLRTAAAAILACGVGLVGMMLQGVGEALLGLTRLAANLLHAVGGLLLGLIGAMVGCWAGVEEWRDQ